MVQKCPNLLVLEEAGTETAALSFVAGRKKSNYLSILFYTTQLSRT